MSKTVNPDWCRDEIILALELYFSTDRGPIDKKNPKIIALSNILRSLPQIVVPKDESTFRNVNGVARKLGNFQSVDPSYKGRGLNHASRLDKAVFKEFYADRIRLRGEGFIECHHKLPLSEIKVSAKTRLEDLALVCSNCHRMLHKTINSTTIKTLKAMIEHQKSSGGIFLF